MPKSGTWITPRSGYLLRRDEKKGRGGRREGGRVKGGWTIKECRGELRVEGWRGGGQGLW